MIEKGFNYITGQKNTKLKFQKKILVNLFKSAKTVNFGYKVYFFGGSKWAKAATNNR